MIVDVKYSRIERVIYEFDRSDIERALMEMAKIPQYQKGKRIEFEMDDDSATITVIHEQPREANDDK